MKKTKKIRYETFNCTKKRIKELKIFHTSQNWKLNVMDIQSTKIKQIKINQIIQTGQPNHKN